MSTTLGMAAAAAFTVAAVTCGLGNTVRSPDVTPIRPERAESAVLQRGEHVADGTVWRGKTTLPLGSGAWVTIDEELVLAEDETLVRAFTHVRSDGGETSTWYDPRAGLVTTERADGTTRRRIPTDARWVYGPVRMPGGDAVGTPLSAWVTYRAATHGESLRVVDAAGSALVPVDQLVVPTERGGVVLLGDDAIDVDGTFIASLHVQATKTTFVRVDPFGTEVHFRRMEPRGT